MEYNLNTISISQWAEEDRPREKLQHLGKHNLTDAEMLAILLGSGSKDMNALNLAHSILASVDHDLSTFQELKYKDFMKFKGIGHAKAAHIIAALELGNRIFRAGKPAYTRIGSSEDAFRCLNTHLTGLDHEEFWILMLNKANRVVGKKRISSGGVSATVVDPRIVFGNAVDALASSLILAHNHPSGNLKPSQADIDITNKLKQGATFFDIAILDHLIIADFGFYSFADEGLMKP